MPSRPGVLLLPILPQISRSSSLVAHRHIICFLPLIDCTSDSLLSRSEAGHFIIAVVVENGHFLGIGASHALGCQKQQTIDIVTRHQQQDNSEIQHYIYSVVTRISNTPQEFKIEAFPTSRHAQLKIRLRSVKDPKSEEEESEIYKITCLEYTSIYIGQAKRLVKI